MFTKDNVPEKYKTEWDILFPEMLDGIDMCECLSCPDNETCAGAFDSYNVKDDFCLMDK